MPENKLMKMARLALDAAAKVPVVVVYGSDRKPEMKLALWRSGRMYPRHIVVGDGWARV